MGGSKIMSLRAPDMTTNAQSHIQGSRIGVDMMCILHQAQSAFSQRLAVFHEFKDIEQYVLTRVVALATSSSYAYFVFDGNDLPAKKMTRLSRNKIDLAKQITEIETLLKQEGWRVRKDSPAGKKLKQLCKPISDKLTRELFDRIWNATRLPCTLRSRLSSPFMPLDEPPVS